jgi:hypothetical protein
MDEKSKIVYIAFLSEQITINSEQSLGFVRGQWLMVTNSAPCAATVHCKGMVVMSI